MAEGQTNGAGDCCCEHDSDAYVFLYAPLDDRACPAMQALNADEQHPGLTTGERQSTALAPAFVRGGRPTNQIRITPLPLARLDTPQAHPALRFRVLLI